MLSGWSFQRIYPRGMLCPLRRLASRKAAFELRLPPCLNPEMTAPFRQSLNQNNPACILNRKPDIFNRRGNICDHTVLQQKKPEYT
jgi:hypothetical protein